MLVVVYFFCTCVDLNYILSFVFTVVKHEFFLKKEVCLTDRGDMCNLQFGRAWNRTPDYVVNEQPSVPVEPQAWTLNRDVKVELCAQL